MRVMTLDVGMFPFATRKSLMALMAVVLMFTAGIGMATGSLLTEIAQLETGGESNQYATNTGNGAYGAFQQRTPALEDIGYENADGSWNASASGVASLQDYLNCSSCQIAGETKLLQNDWSYLEANGSVSSYLGKTGADGVVYNESALLECAQQLGASGCKTYLETGTCTYCSTNPHLAEDIAAASETDSSAITGTYTAVDNSAIASGEVSSGTALAQMESYCAPQVAELLKAMGRQKIDNATTMASTQALGYSLMNGEGVLSSTGTSGTYGLNTSGLSSTLFSKATCLDNLLSGLGLSGIFTPPSLSQLASALENAACSALQSEVSEMEQPVVSTLGEIDSSVSSAGGMGFFPGMSMASMTGMNFNLGTSSTGSSGLTVGSSSYNLQSVLNNNSAWTQSVNTAEKTDTTSVYSMGF